MKSFEYASPHTEAEALGLLNEHGSTASETAVLAGGDFFTDCRATLERDFTMGSCVRASPAVRRYCTQW